MDGYLLFGFHDDGLKSFPLLTGLSVVSCGPLNEREEAWPKSKRRINTDKHRFVKYSCDLLPSTHKCY